MTDDFEDEARAAESGPDPARAAESERVDELASAYLDGELDDTARRAVEADPEVMERSDELRRVATMVSTAAAVVDPGRRELAISAALAAFDDAGPVRPSDVDPRAERPGSPVVDLAARRHSRNLRIALAAAAAILVAVVAVPVLARLGDSNDETAASASFEADEQATPTGTEAGADMAAATEAAGAAADDGSDQTAAEAPLAPPMVSVHNEGVDDPRALADLGRRLVGDDAARDSAARAPDLDESTERTFEECVAQPAGESVVAVAAGTYVGTPALFVIFRRSDGSDRIDALDRESCAVLASTDF